MTPVPPARSTPTSVLVALLTVQVFFGVHYLAAKLVVQEMPPRAWAFVRVVGGAVVLWTLVGLLRRRLPRDPAVWGRLALYSLFGIVINQVCFSEGILRTTPTHSSLMNTTIPVATLAFSVLLGRERVRAWKLAALAVALAGVLLVIRPWAASDLGEIRTGDLLTLVNATSFSFFLALSKPLMARIDALAGTAILLGFGSLGLALVGLPTLTTVDLSALSTQFWWLAVFIVLAPTAGAYLLNYWALGKVDPSLVAFFIFVQPLLAATLSWLLLGERPAPATWAGAALIFAGVAWSTRTRPRERAVAQPSSGPPSN